MRAPHGAALSCKSWQQEAALRLLLNSVDPAVAEQAEQFMPTGGLGKLARDAQAFQAIVDSLRKLGDSETLLIRDGAPAEVLSTGEDAPRVLVCNVLTAGRPRFAADWAFTGPASALPEAHAVFRTAAHKHFGGTLAGRLVVSAGMGGMGGAQALGVTLNRGAFLGIDPDVNRIKRRVKAGFCEIMVNHLEEALRILKNAVRKREPASVALIGNAAEVLPELAERGVLPDLLTDQTPGDDAEAYIPRGLTPAEANAIESNPTAARERALDSIAAQVRAMLEMKNLGAIIFDFGNGIFGAASSRGVSAAADIPGFASEYLSADILQGRGLLTMIALSGDSADFARVDEACLALFSGADLNTWFAAGRRHPTPGLPARSLWMTAAGSAKLGAAIHELVARGQITAPVAICRSIRSSVHMAAAEAKTATQSKGAGGTAHSLADSPAVVALLRAASGASWAGVQTAAADNSLRELSFAVVAEGTPESAHRIARAFDSDFAAGRLAAPSLFAI